MFFLFWALSHRWCHVPAGEDHLFLRGTGAGGRPPGLDQPGSTLVSASCLPGHPRAGLIEQPWESSSSLLSSVVHELLASPEGC